MRRDHVTFDHAAGALAVFVRHGSQNYPCTPRQRGHNLWMCGHCEEAIVLGEHGRKCGNCDARVTSVVPVPASHWYPKETAALLHG